MKEFHIINVWASIIVNYQRSLPDSDIIKNAKLSDNDVCVCLHFLEKSKGYKYNREKDLFFRNLKRADLTRKKWISSLPIRN